MEEVTPPNTQERNSFIGEMQAILETPLTPETIDTYADDALDKTLVLLQKTIDYYNRQPTIRAPNAQSEEDLAVQYVGISHIETILDRLQALSDQLVALDRLVADVETTTHIYLPTEPSSMPAPAGESDRSWELTRQSRLKTILFVLQQSFALNPFDSTELHISKGLVDSTMIRQTSYVVLEIPSLERLILVNDERDNATFVWNTQQLQERGISPEQLTQLTKRDLAALLEEFPQFGRYIVYRASYVQDVLAALQPGEWEDSHTVPAESLSYLIPPLPEGYMTRTAAVRELNLTIPRFKQVVEELGDELGELETYRERGNVPTIGYSPAQLARIYERALERGFIIELLPDGYLTAAGLAEKWGLGVALIKKTAELCWDELGEVRKYRSSLRAKPTYGFSPPQQDILHGHLEARGLFDLPPEGYHSLPELASLFRVSLNTLTMVVAILSGHLGTIEKHSYRSVSGNSYSPAQQTVIYEYLEAEGYFREAPEGYVTMDTLTKLLHRDHRTVKDAIADMGAAFGPVQKYRFHAKAAPTPGLSPHQQALLDAYFEA